MASSSGLSRTERTRRASRASARIGPASNSAPSRSGEVLLLADRVDTDRPAGSRLDGTPVKAHPELDHDSLRGIVADLEDADDPVELTGEQAELQRRRGRLGRDALAPERPSESPPDLHR